MAKPKLIILILLASLLVLAVLSGVVFFSYTSTSHSQQNLSTSPTTPPPKDPSTSPTVSPPQNRSTSPTAPLPQNRSTTPLNPPPQKPSGPPPLQLIRQACKATRNPPSCEATLNNSSDYPANPTPVDLIQHSLTYTIQALQKTYSLAKSVGNSPTVGNPNITDSALSCLEGLSNAEFRLNSTLAAIPRGKLKDGRAWTSAALAYEYGCWAGLNNLILKQSINDTRLVNETVAFMNTTLIALTSHSLSMLVSYDLYGDKLDKWSPPRTERDGFWEESGSGLSFKGGFPSGLKPDVTVCKEDGKGCLKTVQEAVNKTPDGLVGKRFVIKITEGVYEEIVRIPIEKKNVVFLGDGMGKTVITGALTVGQPGMNTYRTATVGVVGDGFMARDITFQNTAGPETFQAVAFRSSSDLSIIENCEFLGHQDTLYVHSLRQFYKSCRIEGNIDFIFGNAAAIIQDSTILIRPRQQNPEKGDKNPVTAHGRTDPAQSTGIVILNSVINGTEEYMKLYRLNPPAHLNYLGRPWKEYCRTVFIHCTLGELINPDGWMPWDGDFALKTVYYGEFESTGPGGNVAHRVPWSNQIPKEHVLAYSVESFIQGNEWIATS